MSFKSLHSLVKDAKTLQGYQIKQDFSDENYSYIPITDSNGFLHSSLANLDFTGTLADGVHLQVNSNGKVSVSSPSLGSASYVKTPGGLILCWGNGTRTTEGSETVTFPITFPNQCLNVLISGRISAGTTDSDWYAQVISWTTSNFVWQLQVDNNYYKANGCYYVAIGW